MSERGTTAAGDDAESYSFSGDERAEEGSVSSRGSAPLSVLEARADVPASEAYRALGLKHAYNSELVGHSRLQGVLVELLKQGREHVRNPAA